MAKEIKIKIGSLYYPHTFTMLFMLALGWTLCAKNERSIDKTKEARYSHCVTKQEEALFSPVTIPR